MLTLTTNNVLNISVRDQLRAEQNTGHEKMWVIKSRLNGFSWPPGDLMAHIFLYCWSVCFKKARRRQQNHPTQTLAEKCFDCGIWTQPLARDKKGFKAISSEAGHSIADGVERTHEKKSALEYGQNYLRVEDIPCFLRPSQTAKGQGMAKHG